MNATLFSASQWIRIVPLFCTLILSYGLSYAQEVIEITGTVTSQGETPGPLPFINVIVKGTNTGTTTDLDGNYTITAATDATLVFSYIGFTTQEVAVQGKSLINIVLEEEVSSLDEVVVIGYQSVRKRDLTGATGLVSAEDTKNVVARSVPEALQGLSPGLSVRNGGAPGQNAVVNIRGLSTFYGNASPLYIIDGMYADPNTTINPNDVESIQVLKDASAAAIYGSRAANGVIIITTIKGKEGKPKISASIKTSLSEIPQHYEMMNARDYVITNTNAYNAAGYPLQPAVANYDGSINTDWSDELLRTGFVQDVNATLSGGSETSTYAISAGYFKDQGTLIARDFDRMSLRINTTTDIGKFTFGENLSITNSRQSSPFQGGFAEGNPWYDMWNMVPIIPVRSDALITDQNPGGWGYGSTNTVNTFSKNQVAVADITSVESNFVKLLGNAFIEYNIIDGLKYKFNAGLETSFDKTKSVRRDGSWYQNQSPENSQVTDNRSQFLSYLFEHTLNFDYDLGKHSINGVVGYTQQTYQTDFTSGTGLFLAQFGGNYFTTITSTSNLPGDRTASGGLTKYIINSYLGRLNYTFDDKYLATFTFRSDKDSRFSPDFRTAYFPSGALAWRISNEKFFNVDWVNDLKLRGSYGVLGSANLDPYQYLGFLNQGPNAVFGPNQEGVQGAIQARLASGDLRWEEKKTTNLGFDASLFNNKFNFTFEAFRSVSEDVLVPQPLPGYLGNLQGDPVVNIGSIENRGLEFDLGYNSQATGDFKWNIAANVSIIRNEILKLGNLGIDEETGLRRDYITSGNTRSQVGRSIGDFFLLQSDGLFQNEAEVIAHNAQADYAQPGDVRYVNVQDDGTTDDINNNDRVFAGSPWPDFTTGLQFDASYKDFTLNVQLYGAFGMDIYNDVIRDLDSYGYSNYRRALDPWRPDNTNTSDPRLGVSYAAGGIPADRGIVSNVRGNSDRWIEDGSYLRIRNVELGYNLPQLWLEKMEMNSARVFLSGQNLFTFTGYSGLDPDVVGGGNINLEPGVDNGNYPSSRIISVGFSVGF
ncbi:MAG: TonB-dependent receptor [Leeuwenhoekiella sp.]